MYDHKKIKYSFLFFLLICFHAASQNCDSNYYAFSYQSSSAINLSKSLITPEDNVLCLLDNHYYPPAIAKFTAQGNIIFYNTYNAPYTANGNHPWTELSFTNITSASESSFFITGSVTKHGEFFDNTEVPPARTAAVLINADKYGNVIWSRFFAGITANPLIFSNVLILNNGDAVCYLATKKNTISYGKIICMSSDGNVKWATTLNTGIYYSGDIPPSIKRSLIQLKSGNIVIGDIVYDKDSSGVRGEYHFFSLNPANGSMVWETSYGYDANPFYFPNIDHITELPDGSLSFQTSLAIATPQSPNLSYKALNIITDNTGNVTKIIASYPENDISVITDGIDDGNGNQTLLMQTQAKDPVLLQIDKNGTVIWTYKYGKANKGLPPTCLSKSKEGYNIFLSNFSKTIQLLRTDPAGKLDCDTTVINLKQEPAAFSIYANVNNIHTNTEVENSDDNFVSGFFVVAGTTRSDLQKNTDCQKDIPCCVDFIDSSIQNVSLCEGSLYTLPDQTQVKDSGQYYVSKKTVLGCDSISFYNIHLVKNPANLYVVKDTCFTSEDTLQLHATDGYQNYYWMNNLSASPYYTVKKPGTYWVTVNNACGIKTDTSYVYSQCDFDIYMPSAFTPNGDGKNDVFRVPAQNKNILIRLLIYNRYGQLIFQTTDKNKGWDGTRNFYPQPTGTYVYYLEMEGLTGETISKKGIFVLIR